MPLVKKPTGHSAVNYLRNLILKKRVVAKKGQRTQLKNRLAFPNND